MSGRPPRITPATSQWEALTEALDALAQTGQRTPCAGADTWTSDEPRHRAAAALACRACPLIELCHEAAVSTRERWGVYGGRDRSPRLGPSPRTTPQERTA